MAVNYFRMSPDEIERQMGFGTRVPGFPAAPVVDVSDIDIGNVDFNPTGGDTPADLITKSSSGSGTSAARLAFDKAKFEAEQKAAAEAFARSQTGAQAQADYLRKLLDSGMNIGGLESQIAAQEASGRQYIEDQAKMLADLISGRRTRAVDLTTAGYDALRNYLQANPMQAFAQTQRAVPTVQQNVLEQYMASRGIGAQPAMAGQDVVNAQLAAQAANYNQLLNVLTGAETQQQASRAAEEQMARALAGSQLENIYGQATSGLEQQRLAALNDLANRISAARLQNERDRIAREQALQDAIAKLLGSGLIAARPAEQGGAPTGGGTTGGGTTGGGTTGGGTSAGTGSGAAQQAALNAAVARYGEEFAPVALANLAAAGMSPETSMLIATQNVGNPLVVGGIPDYLRVIQEQGGQDVVRQILGSTPEPYSAPASSQNADQRALEQFVAQSLAQQYGFDPLAFGNVGMV